MTAAIEVENLAAVHRLSIPVPEGGGVVVLRGGHGVGKSNTLKAVDALASGRGSDKLQVRDGAARGEISGCGVRLTVGKRTSRSGELEVTSLDGRLSVAELVDPGMVSEIAADSKRIKALVQLAGVEADPAIFHELFGGPEEFAAVVPADSVKTDDILVLADRVKRAIDTAARSAEGLANTERAHAAACAEAAQGLDLSLDADPETLQSRLESAIRREQELQTQRREALMQNKRVEEARAKLDGVNKTEAGQSLAAWREEQAAAKSALDTAVRSVERIEKELAEVALRMEAAKANLSNATRDLENANERVDAHEKAAATIAEYERALAEAGAAVAPPTQDEIDDASIAVASARRAVENGAVIRAAKRKLEKRDTHLKAAAEQDRRAESLRGAAGNVDSVLSAQIAKLGCPLRVEKGRLVTTTDRGVELYCELSEGERWRIALDIAIDAVGSTGLLTVPQVAWEGLNTRSREAIAEHVRSRGAVMITAEVTDEDDLTAEVYQ